MPKRLVQLLTMLTVALCTACGGGGSGGDDRTSSADTVSAEISSTGGSITLDNTATVTFPDSAFDTTTVVTISRTRDEKTARTFNEFSALFSPSERLTYEVRINTGIVPPRSDTVHVRVPLPEDFVGGIPDGYGVELFALILMSGGEERVEVFELVESTFNHSTSVLEADVPGLAFDENRSSLGGYETVLVIAPTPGSGQSDSTTNRSTDTDRPQSFVTRTDHLECDAAPLLCPLQHGCTVTSPYNRGGRRHPVTGGTRPHYGVDYAASNGSVVLAAAAGTIQNSYSSTGGLGETIIVRHDDGSATLYAHLNQREVVSGDKVNAGQRIGVSDNTGLSSGPHLHLEYVPNGRLRLSKHRIDPHPCVQQATYEATASYIGTGSIQYHGGDCTSSLTIDGDLSLRLSMGSDGTIEEALVALPRSDHTFDDGGGSCLDFEYSAARDYFVPMTVTGTQLHLEETWDSDDDGYTIDLNVTLTDEGGVTVPSSADGYITYHHFAGDGVTSGSVTASLDFSL